MYSSFGLQVAPKADWTLFKSAVRFADLFCRMLGLQKVRHLAGVLAGIRVDSDEVIGTPRYMRYVFSRSPKLVAAFPVLQKWTTVTLSPAFARSFIEIGRGGGLERLVLEDFGPFPLNIGRL